MKKLVNAVITFTGSSFIFSAPFVRGLNSPTRSKSLQQNSTSSMSGEFLRPMKYSFHRDLLNLLICMFLFLFSAEQALSQWNQVNGLNGILVNRLCRQNNSLIAGTGDGIYISSNNGASWSAKMLLGVHINIMCANQQYILAGTNNSGIYLSSNFGANWSTANSGLASSSIASLIIENNIFYAGTGGSGIYRSTNFGTNWITMNNGLSFLYLASFAISGQYFYAGMSGGGLFISTNSGELWSFNSFPNKSVNSIEVIDSRVIISVFGEGIFSTSNNGVNWEAVNSGVANLNTRCLHVYNNTVFLGAGDGVYVSNDQCVSWQKRNEGFPSSPILNSIVTVGETVFSASYLNSVWKRPVSEVISIVNISSIIPERILLHQNYPNPFNPSTIIKFEIPLNEETTRRVVSLRIYDILGSEVKTLVNENLKPGVYEADFNAADLPSGVYFYKLTAGGNVETRKMILLK